MKKRKSERGKLNVKFPNQRKWNKAHKEYMNAARRKHERKYPERYRFKVWRGNIKKRGFSTDITLDQYISLRQGRCAYGDQSPAGTVDRKDNSIGYFASNCVSCCYRHNSIKGSWFTHEEMLKIVRTIAGA